MNIIIQYIKNNKDILKNEGMSEKSKIFVILIYFHQILNNNLIHYIPKNILQNNEEKKDFFIFIVLVMMKVKVK